MEFTTELYQHQKDAVEKLRHTKVGALYMSPGTGKTRTTLELIKLREDAGKTNAILWLCPCSVKENLYLDIVYHCGEMPSNLIIRGIESISGSDRLYVDLLQFVSQYNVYLVIDESNLVKNHKAKRTERISQLSQHCQYKLILNGTPVSRNEADLFAQWWILDPDILGYKSYYSFAANHIEYWTVKDINGREHKTNDIKQVLDIPYLTQKIAPYTYQIKMEDTGIELPPVSYHSERFDLTEDQWMEYQATKELFLANVDEFDSTTIYKLFTALQHVSSGRLVTSPPKAKMRTKEFFDDWHDNPRMEALRDVVSNDIGDEQCIIFGKFQAEIDDMKALLDEQGITWREFTGKGNLKTRVAALKDFREGKAQYLLANKKCGAYGLNLQFCHNIIFYDNDFEYATREQAEDRIHRIGQVHKCHIWDIYGNDTIDEMIRDNLDNKDSMIRSFKAWIKKNQTKTVDQMETETKAS